MGIFNRKRDIANVPADPASTLGTADTLPAVPNSMTERITSGGSAMVEKATRIYKENPKLVGGIALVASALLLNRMKGRSR